MPFLLYTIIYLPLLVLALLFLTKALKRKNSIQIAVFTVCAVFCGFRIVQGFLDFNDLKIAEKEYDRVSLRSLPAGDTALIEGTISFHAGDLYQHQDSINVIFKDSLNRLYLTSTVEYLGEIEAATQLIELSHTDFISLQPYLNYEQQRIDSSSYKIRLKVKKLPDLPTSGYLNHWRLIDVVGIQKQYGQLEPL